MSEVCAERGVDLTGYLGPHTTLVPVPGHALRRDDDLWPALELCRALVAAGYGHSVEPLLKRSRAVPKSALIRSAADRPSPIAHLESLRVTGRPHRNRRVDARRRRRDAWLDLPRMRDGTAQRLPGGGRSGLRLPAPSADSRRSARASRRRDRRRRRERGASAVAESMSIDTTRQLDGAGSGDLTPAKLTHNRNDKLTESGEVTDGIGGRGQNRTADTGIFNPSGKISSG